MRIETDCMKVSSLSEIKDWLEKVAVKQLFVSLNH